MARESGWKSSRTRGNVCRVPRLGNAWRRRALPRWLALAGALHLTAIHLASMEFAQPQPPQSQGSIAITFEVDAILDPALDLSTGRYGLSAPRVAPVPPSGRVVEHVASLATSTTSARARASISEGIGEPDPARDATESSEASSSERGSGEQRRLSLGQLGVSLDSNPLRSFRPGDVATNRELGQALSHSLRTELARRDQQRGLGPEGPVLTAIKHLVEESTIAESATATLLIRADADGRVTLGEAVEASRGADEWKRIALALPKFLRGQRLRIPPHTGGVSLIIEVTSRPQLPSGADSGTEIALLGQTLVAGGGARSASIKILTPELSHEQQDSTGGEASSVPMPRISLAIVAGTGDIADLGRSQQRVVHASLASMEVHAPP